MSSCSRKQNNERYDSGDWLSHDVPPQPEELLPIKDCEISVGIRRKIYNLLINRFPLGIGLWKFNEEYIKEYNDTINSGNGCNLSIQQLFRACQDILDIGFDHKKQMFVRPKLYEEICRIRKLRNEIDPSATENELNISDSNQKSTNDDELACLVSKPELNVSSNNQSLLMKSTYDGPSCVVKPSVDCAPKLTKGRGRPFSRSDVPPSVAEKLFSSTVISAKKMPSGLTMPPRFVLPNPSSYPGFQQQQQQNRQPSPCVVVVQPIYIPYPVLQYSPVQQPIGAALVPPGFDNVPKQ